jgi:hypothetical protein
VKVNVRSASIVLIGSLFAAQLWADETANAANAATARTVAAANSTGVKPRTAVNGATRVTVPAASETRPQRQPPAGVEVLSVYSERDEGAPEQTD